MIDIRHEMNCLKEDINYIDHIGNLVNCNWSKYPLETKALMNEVLVYTEQNDKRAYIKAIIYMSGYYIYHADYVEGTKRILEAYELSKALNYPLGRMHLCHKLMLLYIKQGEIDAGFEYGLEGIDIAKEYGEKDLELSSVLNISIIHLYSKDYTVAEGVIRYTQNGNYTYNDENSLLASLLLANTYFKLDRIQEAKLQCDKAYQYAIKLDKEYLLAEVLYIKGKILKQCNQLEAAEKILIKSKKMAQTNGYKELFLRQIVDSSRENIVQGITEDVEEDLLKALNLAKELNVGHLLEDVYKLLENFYTSTENWKEAYEVIKAREEIERKSFERRDKTDLVRLEQKRMVGQMQNYKRLYHQMQMISEVGQKFTANLDIEKNIEMIYEQVNKLAPADVVGLGMYKKNGELLYKAYGKDGNILDTNKKLYERAFILGKYVLETGKDTIINGDEIPAYLERLEGYKYSKEDMMKSTIFIHLQVEGVIIGVIGIGSYTKDMYSKNDLRSLQILGSYIAVALRNAELFNEVEYLAMHDSLTQIYNRGTILRLGYEQFERNKLNNKSTAIIMLDIDYFKKINDQYGHLFGDKVLSSMGGILKNIIRKEDLLGRYGGEEFIIALNNVTLENAKKIAERIHNSVQEYKFMNDNEERIPITISSGVYLCNMEESFEKGIRNADKALYDAKVRGRNRVVIYKEK